MGETELVSVRESEMARVGRVLFTPKDNYQDEF